MDAPQPALGKPSVTASGPTINTGFAAADLWDGDVLHNAVHDPGELVGAPRPSKWRTLGGGKQLLPQHRIAYCHSKVGFGRLFIDVMKKNDSVYFSGVHRCGSVWACPVCSAAISGGRRKELQTAIDKAVTQGHGVALATFTFSHGLNDALAELLPGFRTALRRLKSGRQWQRIQQAFGVVGTVKALEVTHGNNGWHPHEHQLVFTSESLTTEQLEAMRAAIFPLWLAACKKAGLPAPSAERGVQIQGAHQAAQYVGKFGFASELTRAQSKRGKLAGRTQWDLLNDYTASNGTDLRSGELFKEYVAAFARSRQLVWSRGLRDWLQLGELFTDDQLAGPDDADAKLIVELDLDTWALITRGKYLEDVVEKAKLGRDVLLEFLNWVRDHCPLWDGRIVGAKSRAEWVPEINRARVFAQRKRRFGQKQTH